MPHIRLDREGTLLVVTLDRPRANALDAAMVDELHAAIDAAGDPSIRGVVLASSSHKVFCAGFDVAEVFAYDKRTMTRFFDRFTDLFERVRRLPKPVVAAMSGHAYAAGAILALAADVRVMADGAGLALNEVNLGLVLPTRMIRALALNGGRQVMRLLLLSGDAITASRAEAEGLVTEVAPAVDVLPVSLTRMRHLAEKPPLAFAGHKEALDTVGPPLTEVQRQAELEHVVDVWFSEEATERRRVLMETLGKK
jgi:enoyl-CoA hydratase/carnithine racemase